MVINIDNVFNMHEKSLKVLEQRSNILANNIVNSDTPNFKARDVDFKAVLSNYAAQLSSDVSNNKFICENENISDESLQYRIPTQPSVDGNTVNGEVEKAAFAENTTRYFASLAFMNQHIKSVMLAIRGE